jgi:hypothetical protein
MIKSIGAFLAGVISTHLAHSGAKRERLKRRVMDRHD